MQVLGLMKSLCASYKPSSPDKAIDARDCEHGPFPSPNPIVGGKNLFEHKTLASLLVSVQARARKVLTDIKRRAHPRPPSGAASWPLNKKSVDIFSKSSQVKLLIPLMRFALCKEPTCFTLIFFFLNNF